MHFASFYNMSNSEERKWTISVDFQSKGVLYEILSLYYS